MVDDLIPINSNTLKDPAVVLRRWVGQRVHPIYIAKTVETLASATNSSTDWERVQDHFIAALRSENPPTTYCANAARAVLQMLERKNIPMTDTFIEYYAEIVAMPSSIGATQALLGTSSTSTAIISYPANRSGSAFALIEESPDVISAEGCTGFRTWEAALALSHHILESTSEKYSTIIELGAGTGLVGLIASTHYAPQIVMLTDGDENVVNVLNETLTRNAQTLLVPRGVSTADAACVFWGNSSHLDLLFNKTKMAQSGRTLILAADVTYDPSAASALVDTLAKMINNYGKNTTDVLLSATIRSKETFDTFAAECNSHKLRMTEIRRFDPPAESQYYFIPPSSPPICIYSLRYM
ncbi:uncharacterized protein SAPINGB_P002940 [Magnusiomyces paraingens]|uniref:FAM86 N-terminal domain-containing protein n=1 Tax=Magnusiomyces paraingens TaxID=2606893 RepID=A0A5E8BMP8_9ASCO|nr:uncharacterized protein SAPINGB_P002940 [Saprochaete ingens]VVT50968.1 unnamed protein product [Saprochaete ingens]